MIGFVCVRGAGRYRAGRGKHGRHVDIEPLEIFLPFTRILFCAIRRLFHFPADSDNTSMPKSTERIPLPSPPPRVDTP